MTCRNFNAGRAGRAKQRIIIERVLQTQIVANLVASDVVTPGAWLCTQQLGFCSVGTRMEKCIPGKIT